MCVCIYQSTFEHPCLCVYVYIKVPCEHSCSVYISRVLDQNGVSRLYNMLEIHHSGPEPSICVCIYKSTL